VPVIATRTGGLEDVVEEGISGLLVPPSDSQGLARAIEKFFTENLGPRLTQGVAGARTRFTWDALRDALVSLSEECR
jgi:glycosyltransferase involved in cell wall biosynthesis